jgi:hypothetical protein
MNTNIYSKILAPYIRVEYPNASYVSRPKCLLSRKNTLHRPGNLLKNKIQNKNGKARVESGI